jgi:hypothetical protein
MNRLRVRIATRGAMLLALSTWLLPACSPDAAETSVLETILVSNADPVSLQLVDAMTTRPLAATAIRVRSDNGIRCVTTPCPTGAQEWSGTTDSRGIAAVPKRVFQASISIETAGHSGDDLDVDADAGTGGVYVVALYPDRINEPDQELHPLRLIDARRHRPISDADISLDYGGAKPWTSRTNALGYVFVPYAVKMQADEKPSIVAPGYRRSPVDFAWVRRRIEMRPD